MQNQAVLLYHLQHLDQEIARQRARLRAIDAQLNGDETVTNALQQLEAAQEALKPAQARARDLDLEIKSVADKAKADDADLYGGSIQNPKALQELQEEVESLKRHQSQLEESLLETMMQVEQYQTQVAGAQQTLDDARAAFASKRTELLEEQQRLQAEASETEAQRHEMVTRIDPASLAAYDKLRPRFKGQVVAVFDGEGCTICGVGQTSVAIKQIHLGRTLIYCESCGRILADIS